MDKAILTCALTGVLTNPKQHPVPVTPAQMAAEARDAFNAGASDHARAPAHAGRRLRPHAELGPGRGRGRGRRHPRGLPGRDHQPDHRRHRQGHLRARLACLRRVKPEIAACNAGSLNYLKIKDNGEWAWPPMVFDNPVAKIQQFLDVMAETGTHPEFECFDVGIVRSVGMYLKAGLFDGRAGATTSSWAWPPACPATPTCWRCCRATLPPGAVWQTHADRPRRDLAGAPEDGRARRHAAHRAGGHLLPARRRARRAATAC